MTGMMELDQKKKDQNVWIMHGQVLKQTSSVLMNFASGQKKLVLNRWSQSTLEQEVLKMPAIWLNIATIRVEPIGVIWEPRTDIQNHIISNIGALGMRWKEAGRQDICQQKIIQRKHLKQQRSWDGLILLLNWLPAEAVMKCYQPIWNGTEQCWQIFIIRLIIYQLITIQWTQDREQQIILLPINSWILISKTAQKLLSM